LRTLLKGGNQSIGQESRPTAATGNPERSRQAGESHVQSGKTPASWLAAGKVESGKLQELRDTHAQYKCGEKG
jgi:hypothetical protein